jgi:hypothetical protein
MTEILIAFTACAAGGAVVWAAIAIERRRLD